MREFSQPVSNTNIFSPYLFVDTGTTCNIDEQGHH